MQIPKRNIFSVHTPKESKGVALQMYIASANGRLSATEILVDRLSALVPVDAQVITSATNIHSLRLGEALARLLGLPFVPASRVVSSADVLRNRQVILVADSLTLDAARAAYARLLQVYPLTIKVVSFLS